MKNFNNGNGNGNSVKAEVKTQEVIKMNENNINNGNKATTVGENKIFKEVSTMTNVNNTLSNSVFSAQMEKEIAEFEKLTAYELMDIKTLRKREYSAQRLEKWWEWAIEAIDRTYLDSSKSVEEKEEEARRDAEMRLFEDTHVLDRDEERCMMEKRVRSGYEESDDSFWDEHMSDTQKRACNLMALFTIDKDIAANNTFYRKGIKNVPHEFHEVEVAITAFRAPGLVDTAFWAPRLRAMIDKIVAYQQNRQNVVVIQFNEIWAAFKAVVENYGIDNVPPVYKILYTWYYDHATKEEKRDFEEYLPKAMNRFSWVYTTGRSSSKYPIYNVWRNIALGRNINDAPDGVSPEFADKIRAYTDKAYALLFTEAREYSADELDDLEAKAMRYYREKFWEAKYLPKVGMDYNKLVKRASENETAWKILDRFDDMTDKDASEYAARVIKSRQAEMAKIRAQEPLRRYAEALIDAMCEGLNDDQDYSKR